MKELAGLAHNVAYFKQDDTYKPIIEVVLLVSEPYHSIDAGGEPTRARQVDNLRFATNPAGLRDLAEKFNRIADEAEEK